MSRVTLLNMQRNVFENTQRNLSRVSELQDQLSSGKRLQKMSDDPVSGRRALVGRIELFEGGRYIENIEKSIAFMDATDATMSEISKLFDSAKDIAVQGANGTQDEASRRALAQSTDSVLESLVDLTNTVHDGRYLFSGTASFTKPFELNAARDHATYLGELDSFQIDVSFSSRATVNPDGHSLWKNDVDIFDAVIELRDALEANDPQAITNMIAEIDEASAHVSTVQGQLGGRVERLELSRVQLESAQVHLGEIISREEDVDIAETIMSFQTAQTALEASLQAGARVVQRTLLDFL